MTATLQGASRKAGLHARLTTRAEEALPHCPIPGCGRPPEARAEVGFSPTHCRFHVQARNRFGSFWKRNIPAATLRTYRQAAERYLKAHAADFWIKAALIGLEALLDGAGEQRHPTEVKSRFVGPREKARASLARLRKAEVSPKRLLSTYLAVAGAIAEDPVGPGGEPGEYRRVQAAKACFRLASGFHSVYGPGQRFDRYPRSSGRMLRHLGGMLEGQCELVREEHLKAILASKSGGGGTVLTYTVGRPLAVPKVCP